MDPNHAKYGYKPNSNQIYQNEQLLIESKRDKCVEIFKQCTEVFEILEAAKKDPIILQATNGGHGLDPSSMCESLMKDRHFNNSKLMLSFKIFLVLGDLLNKRPVAKKVEVFMAKHLQTRINEIAVEMKIKSKFLLINLTHADSFMNLQQRL